MVMITPADSAYVIIFRCDDLVAYIYIYIYVCVCRYKCRCEHGCRGAHLAFKFLLYPFTVRCCSRSGWGKVCYITLHWLCVSELFCLTHFSPSTFHLSDTHVCVCLRCFTFPVKW
ncbi:hypothetical protein, unlikely [Trypanosoma brucei gambiense DAL972]|uniref:Uncharacterized protein n=1 Tax=Trypanosoma brucei gambiense (strain MHOM/CI/86/DAL972) TaxID=679716 RepID=D0A1E1_TRYB9|nr:hypothetical protein, unlikely [Trypanosoma brucei gambiense DAL972]CBH15083.1 hypothetical protein, unlikely [Trypanosoma brucei gambiense DAL972]|eukprot:XP_011777349.1 hypothetical protein, unlikely [Trypanosoma brucei gambiense DAL972]